MITLTSVTRGDLFHSCIWYSSYSCFKIWCKYLCFLWTKWWAWVDTKDLPIPSSTNLPCNNLKKKYDLPVYGSDFMPSSLLPFGNLHAGFAKLTVTKPLFRRQIIPDSDGEMCSSKWTTKLGLKMGGLNCKWLDQ